MAFCLSRCLFLVRRKVRQRVYSRHCKHALLFRCRVVVMPVIIDWYRDVAEKGEKSYYIVKSVEFKVCQHSRMNIIVRTELLAMNVYAAVIRSLNRCLLGIFRYTSAALPPFVGLRKRKNGGDYIEKLSIRIGGFPRTDLNKEYKTGDSKLSRRQQRLSSDPVQDLIMLLSLAIDPEIPKIETEKQKRNRLRAEGIAWQVHVQEHVDLLHKKLSLLRDYGSPTFNYIIKLPVGLRHPNEHKNYFVFDIYYHLPRLATKGGSRSVEIKGPVIVEIKLSVSSLTLKEIKYLYYYPEATLVLVFFFPANADRVYKVLEEYLQEFHRRYGSSFMPDLRARVKVYDNTTLNFPLKREHELMSVLKDWVVKILKILQALSYYSRPLVYSEIADILGDSGTVIRLLNWLVDKHVVVKERISYKDKGGRVLFGPAYKLSPTFSSSERFTAFLEQVKVKLPAIDPKTFQITLREPAEYALNEDDIKVLLYLRTFPTEQITPSDILSGTGIPSTHDIWYTLRKLANINNILDEDEGWFLDSRGTPRYGYFYRIKSEYLKDKEFNDFLDRSAYEISDNPPQQIKLDYPLSIIEIKVMLYLYLKGHTTSERAVPKPAIAEAIKTSLETFRSTFERLKKSAKEKKDILLTKKGAYLDSKGQLFRRDLVYLNPRYADDPHFTSFLRKMKKKLHIEIGEPKSRRIILAYPMPLAALAALQYLKKREAFSSSSALSLKEIKNAVRRNEDQLRVALKHFSTLGVIRIVKGRNRANYYYIDRGAHEWSQIERTLESVSEDDVFALGRK